MPWAMAPSLSDLLPSPLPSPPPHTHYSRMPYIVDLPNLHGNSHYLGGRAFQ